ncbi:MAG: rod shape-determining protein MreD [Odoribacter sp.]|nr:rod shape-determining protein MreD [Odoribacter sp.]
MNNVKYIVHVVILYILQLTILDNIQLHSYVYINIYVLVILTLPYNYKKTSVLLLGFLFGLLVDLVNNTMGIHAAATTFIAYLRPRLLLLISNRDQMDDIQGAQKVSSFSWFLKYTLLLTTAFNIVLLMAEAFTFSNFGITLLRIVCSTLASCFFIMLYYFIALKKKQD